VIKAEAVATGLTRLSEILGTRDHPASVGVADADSKAPLHRWKNGVDPYDRRGALLHLDRIRQEQAKPPLSTTGTIPAQYIKATAHTGAHSAFGKLAARSGRRTSALVSNDASNLVAVDLDVRSDRNGNVSLREFEERHGVEFPPTLSATTPARGRHLIYRQPAELLGFAPIKSCIGFRPGFDIKAEGSYVLAPSDGLDGRVWIDDAYPVVELPMEIASLLVDKEAKPASRPSRCTLPPPIRTAEAAYFDNAGLALQLAKVDPREYRDYALWFRFLCACHAVTAGTGLDAFLEWCARDPAYPAHLHAAKVAASWNWLSRGEVHG
jgi:hypothetical protein